MTSDIGKDQQGSATSISFTPIIINSGSTPTHDMEFVLIDPLVETLLRNGHPQAEINNSPNDPESFFAIADARPQTYALGPHVELPRTSPPITINGQLFQDIVGARVGKFYYGAIRYHDMFDPSIEHITKYCFAVNNFVASTNGIAPQGPAIKATAMPFYTICPHWNCADDECEQDRRRYDEEMAASKLRGPPPAPGMPK